MTTIAGSVVENKYSWGDEGPWEAQVYDNQGRLILVSPPKTSGKYQTFQTRQDAIARILECFPDIPIVESLDKLEKYYKADGWHYPSDLDTYTPYLCVSCGGSVTLAPRSRGAGQNAPYGAPVLIFYDCHSCDAQYVERRQEVRDGWLISWSVRSNQDRPFLLCEQPQKLATVNPFDFEEHYLVLTKQKEDDTMRKKDR